MKQQTKNNKQPGIRAMLFAGLLVASLGTSAQKPSMTADPELGKIMLTDQAGLTVDANFVQPGQVINLRIPVMSDNHGKELPGGSAMIKIGFGSKIELDPQFNINNAGLGNYFRWTSANNGGQVEVTGELIASLPPGFTAVNVSFKVKAVQDGSSTITANFLITNHNTNTILSDEDGANNAASLAYRVSSQASPVIQNGKLKLNLYPNPAKDVKSVTIEVVQGELKGRYSIVLMDMLGKTIQRKEVDLNSVPNFKYAFGNIAQGKYLVKITGGDEAQSIVLPFEKL